MSSPNSNSVTFPRGFRVASGTCGIKVSGNPDLMLLVADDVCSTAGVFTRNRAPGAPVIVSRRHLRTGQARAIICNSGCSNVCTGQQGIDDAREMCALVAHPLAADPRQVLVCSTGVIGHLLPMDKIRRGIAVLQNRLQTGPRADGAAARAIMTTDLKPKFTSRTVRLGKQTVRLGGMCKGSGMIAPNMATMLAFLTTDAAITPALLKQALKQAANHSFNRISVDHDTSTSDSVLLLASGAAKNPIINKVGPDFEKFAAALTELCDELAYMIVRDGEGATKVFRVAVRGAASTRDADKVGHTAVGSPLVKTAIHGGDPNWGRFVMAAGRSGAKLNPQKLDITIGDIPVCLAGRPVEHDRKTMRRLVKLMNARDITITLDLHLGKGEATWLGCDLSRQYVTINADYTT